jgi:hypothetical protein
VIIKSDTSGLTDLIARVQEARAILPQLLVDAAQSAGDAVVGELHDAAPQGQGGSVPPPGDGPGALAESFYAIAERQADSGVVEVKTTQPLKLSYVRDGTGIYAGNGMIVPTQKKALMWEGAAHPFRSVAGQRANDFISPVIADTNDTVEGEMQVVVEELSSILGGA